MSKKSTKIKIIMTNFKLVVVMVVMVAVIGSSPLAQAQEKADCVKTTKPCLDYMKSENPPSECCEPLKAAVKSSLVCVCSIYGDTQFLKLIGIDSKAALSLPQRCGIDIDFVTSCQAALTPKAPSPTSTGNPSDQPAASPTGAASPSAPTTTVTTTPGPSDGKNAASNMALSGVTVFGSLVMWATLML